MLNGVNVGSDTNYYANSTLNNGDVLNCYIKDRNFGFFVDSSAGVIMSVHNYFMPSVSIAAVGGDTVCEGTLMSFNGTFSNSGVSPTLDWYVNGILKDSGSSYSYVPLNTDSVKVKMISHAHCALNDTIWSSSMNLTVHANVIPAISILSISGDTVCAGTSVIFNTTIENGGASPLLIWKVNGTNRDTNSVFHFTPSNGDSIACMLFSNATCRANNDTLSNVISMIVNPLVTPFDSISAGSATIYAGEPATVTAYVVNGGSSPIFQWYVNGVPVSAATSTSYAVSSLNAFDTVTCQVTSDAPCAAIATVNSNKIIVAPTVGEKIIQGGVNKFAVLPNPNKGIFAIQGTTPEVYTENLNYSLMEVTGRVIYTGILPIGAGKLNVSLSILNNQPTGIYLLQIEGMGLHETIKIVKE